MGTDQQLRLDTRAWLRRVSAITLVAMLLALAACARGGTAPTPTQAPIATPTPIPGNATVLDKASAFVGLLVERDFAAAAEYFDATMSAQLPAPALGQTWDGLVAQTGPFQAVERMQSSESGPYTIVVVTSRFEAAAIDIRVTFDQEERIAGLFFTPAQSTSTYAPPAYANPELFREVEVVIGDAPWELPGTLTLPDSDGPFPAVVLVHGSGPNDRDETIGPNKPFMDIAWGLASQGVAVLRYEKRTRVYPNEIVASMDSFTIHDEVVDDALAAVRTLRGADGIDPARVFVVGHSLGGTMAPAIAEADPELAGIVILAGSTRPLEDIILEQMTYLASLDGSISDQEQAQLDEVARQAEKVRTLDIAPGEVVLGGSRTYWESLAAYDPAATVAELAMPILVLQGGRDYQVTAVDLAGWEAALRGASDVTIREYPALNHLFIAGEGTPSPAEYDVHGSVSAEVVQDIAEWTKGS